MPNYVQNIVRINCPESRLKNVRSLIWKTAKCGGEFFDFNSLIPMPESLNFETECPETVKNANHLKITGAFTDGLTAQEQKTAREYLHNEKEHGHMTWYGWRREKWGTKWNSSDCSFEDNLLIFQTAWNHPIPVMLQLFRKFPDIRFDVQFADEDYGRNMGIYSSPVPMVAPGHLKFSPESCGIALKIWDTSWDEYLERLREEDDDGSSATMNASERRRAEIAFRAHKLP